MNMYSGPYDQVPGTRKHKENTKSWNTDSVLAIIHNGITAGFVSLS